MNLTRNDWSGGWNPSNDNTNGNNKQLLEMQNLCLDKDGVLSLVKGTQVISGPYPDVPIALYSTFIEGRKFRYVALNSGSIYRLEAYSTDIGDNRFQGGGNYAYFASGWGETFITTPGRHNFKDNISESRTLGLPTPPNIPSITRYEQQSIYVEGDLTTWTCEEGTNFETSKNEAGMGGYVKADSAADTNRIVLKVSGIDIDSTAFTEGRSELMDDDTFTMSVQVSDSQNLDWCRIEFWLEDPEGGSNYFYTEWQNNENTPFNQGIDSWSNLTCRRGDFLREGTDSEKWWYNIKAIRIIFQGVNFIYCSATGLKFSGGPKGQLTGVYQYVAVNVYNSGNYVSISPMGPKSGAHVITNGHFEILPPQSEYYAASGNEIWIFRRSIYTEETSTFPLGLLDKFYRVLVFTQDEYETVKSDDMDDITALKQPTLNEYLLSVRDIPEDIYCMALPIYDRAIYMTPSDLYISDSNNPDSIDTRYTIRLGSSQGEKNLFVSKLSEGVLLAATTRDIYLITGDFTSLPDGTLNISVKPLNEAHPPISHHFCSESGTVFYMASDGWRSTNGSYSSLISPQLNPLFHGESNFDISPIAIIPNGSGNYSIAVGKGRIFTSVPLTDGRRMVFIYDLLKSYWYVMYTDPVVFYTEEDGTILAGYSWGSGTYVREFYTGDSLDGINGQDIKFRTIFDDNGQPRNRKETFTFKLSMDTGNKPVNIYIAKDNGEFTHIGSYSFDGVEEKIIDIASLVGTGIRFAVLITGTDLYTCRIVNYSFEYSPYPEQLTSFRIPYSNLGTPSRKRIVNYPIVIDTLGNNVTLTPYIDGVASSAENFILNRKGTYTYFFSADTIGIDVGAYLSGGPFEFYEVDTDEIVSEKLPNPTKYLVIPPNDYGNPNRKRHSSYKFQINTRGYDVKFTPVIDGVSYTPLTFSTTDKKTVPYYFTVDTIGIDIGGILETLEDEEFEYYGTLVPQKIEVLPDMLKEFWIPETNLGVAAPKRLRTLPLVINTRGNPVTFTPYVDNVAYPSSILNTSTRQTAFHYFTTDVFGTDLAGELVGTEYFEFYDLLRPEAVEVLPVAKKFDQLGPFRFDSLGKLLTARIRLIPTFSEKLTLKVFNESCMGYPNTDGIPPIYSSEFYVQGGLDDVYEINFPKTVMGTVFRFELGPATFPFHRYDIQIRVNIAGKVQSLNWVDYANNQQSQ